MRYVQALGWYVIFGHVSSMEDMRRHYGGAVGLPPYLKCRIADGQAENKDYFWGGEAIVLDINYGGTIPAADPRQADGATARQTPIWRTHRLEEVVADMQSRGLQVGPVIDGPYGREATIVDPMGLVMGLRESPPRPTLYVDREALRRRRRGEAFNPGCLPMPANVPELGWIRMRAQDPGALTEFYATRLGLPLIDAHAGSTLLDLGDNVALEIAGGGNRREPPSAQMGALSAAILRVTRLPELISALTEAGAHFVGGRYSSPKGDWVYIADPEGNLVGLADRRHPGSYCAVLPVAPEDLEAARRAAEAVCAPAQHDRR